MTRKELKEASERHNNKAITVYNNKTGEPRLMIPDGTLKDNDEYTKLSDEELKDWTFYEGKLPREAFKLIAARQRKLKEGK